MSYKATQQYTAYQVEPQVIDDGLGHHFQVMEVRCRRDHMGIWVDIDLDQYDIPYPQSKSTVYHTYNYTWYDSNGATIYNQSLTDQFNLIRQAIIEREESHAK